ncbi:MAG: 3-phosphoshikimate 1-carboxyvinyltransferase [Ginsengibacter sp.]
MIVSVSPAKVSGKVKVPASKSSMQRACAAALLTPGSTILSGYGDSNDEQAALNIITQLGAIVKKAGEELIITSSEDIFTSFFPDKNLNVHCGESGLSMRMFAPIAALFNFNITFIGEGSILTRPMNFFDEHLPPLGVEITSNQGKLPLTIKGPLQPKEITVDGSLSSQFLTGLLFAFAKSCKKPVNIRVRNLQSKPYIDLTLSVLAHFGFNVTHQNYGIFTISPRNKPITGSIKYKVEGDWSNAAFLLVAGAIGGSVTLCGTDLNSSQGDKAIMEALYNCGADVQVNNDEITITHGELKGFTFDATHCPDLFPPLVALAVNCQGTTTIQGVHRLTHKESNRAVTLREEFRKMGADIEYEGDVMTIKGGNSIFGTSVFSHHDHRIAMACAVAALTAEGVTVIEGAEAINKSYPGFYKDLEAIKN